MLWEYKHSEISCKGNDLRHKYAQAYTQYFVQGVIIRMTSTSILYMLVCYKRLSNGPSI